MVADMEVKTYMFALLSADNQIISNYCIESSTYKDALIGAKNTLKEFKNCKISRIYNQENFFKTPYWNK